MAVYMIRAGDDGPVKIGCAVDPSTRRKDLQTAHFLPLRIIRVAEGGRLEESWLHKHYKQNRTVGEWFIFCPTMLTISVPLVKAPEPVASQEPTIAGELPTATEVKAYARKFGLTVAQLCREAGLAPSILNRWDTGETSPTIGNVARLLDVLAKHETERAA